MGTRRESGLLATEPTAHSSLASLGNGCNPIGIQLEFFAENSKALAGSRYSQQSIAKSDEKCVAGRIDFRYLHSSNIIGLHCRMRIDIVLLYRLNISQSARGIVAGCY